MITAVLHRAAGLTFSADRRLPGFVPAAGHAGEDVRIHLESVPAWHADPPVLIHPGEPADTTTAPAVTVSRSAHGFHFSYADGTRIWVAGTGADVWCTWPATASLQDTCTYLYGPILGLILRLRGAVSFHASAVRIGDGAIAFAGPRGAGKSTLAAALGAAGCAVVTDDVLHVRREGPAWVAEPFASMLKLWPDGARLALGDATELPLIADGWDKRALALGTRLRAADTPLPMIAFACFAPPAAQCGLTAMSPGAALVRLAGNTSAAHLLDADGRASEFRLLSQLVRAVPCVELTPPQQRADYASFVTRVLDWSRDPHRAAAR